PPPFPTRRSSDLGRALAVAARSLGRRVDRHGALPARIRGRVHAPGGRRAGAGGRLGAQHPSAPVRFEPPAPGARQSRRQRLALLEHGAGRGIYRMGGGTGRSPRIAHCGRRSRHVGRSAAPRLRAFLHHGGAWHRPGPVPRPRTLRRQRRRHTLRARQEWTVRRRLRDRAQADGERRRSMKPIETRGVAGNRHQAIPRVLVVDDEADLRELLELTLVGMGLDVDCAADVAEAVRQLDAAEYALCLTDMRLPDGTGLELVERIAREHPNTPVAVITAYGSAENAVAALKAGAFDYLAKPVALESVRNLVRSAIRLPAATTATPAAPAEPPADPTARMLGVSAAVAEVRAQILRLARSMAPVAITGESGSGKELAARLVHEAGVRGDQPFIAVNCGAIPENLMEAEFF